MFREQECVEPLVGLPPTPANIRYASNRRGEILTKIAKGVFNYADEFPESERAAAFGFSRTGKTIEDLLADHERLTRPTVEESTWLSYHRVIERFWRPRFGRVRVRDLTSAMIRDALLEGRIDEDTGEKTLITLKTARNIVSVMNVPLRRAVADGELPSNPLDAVDLTLIWPKDHRDSGWKADPFAFDEMLAIFGACRNEEEADYWRIAFGTGMRPSEQMALAWPFCNLVELAVRIEVAQVMGLDGATEKGPKTFAGRRVIPMTQGAYEALQRQHERTGASGGRVFRDTRYDAPWRDDQALRRRFERICRKAGVRYRNPYQTRHTFASVQLAAGRPPLQVAKWMGHETTEMLERRYGRWIEQGQNMESRAQLAEFFRLAGARAGEVVRIA